MARNPTSQDQIGAAIRSDEEIRQLRLRRPSTSGSSRQILELDTYLDQWWESVDAKIIREGNVCVMCGALRFNPDRTPADVTAGEPGSIKGSHYYATQNIISTVGSTLGKNSPTVTYAGSGTPIPAAFRPTADGNSDGAAYLAMSLDWNRSTGAFRGGSIEMKITSAGYFFGYATGGGTIYPVVTDSYGVSLSGLGFVGLRSSVLLLDGTTYLAD